MRSGERERRENVEEKRAERADEERRAQAERGRERAAGERAERDRPPDEEAHRAFMRPCSRSGVIACRRLTCWML